MGADGIKLTILVAVCLAMAFLAVHPRSLSEVDWTQWIQALSALAMVALTSALMVVARRQSAIAETQADLALSQHISMNRPRLLVREVNLLQEYGDKRCWAQFHVVNVGGSKAKPVCSVVRLDRSQRNGRPYSIYPKLTYPPERENFIDAETLDPGEVMAHAVAGTFEWDIMDEALARPNAARLNLDVIALHGTIFYHDENQTMRQTSFWRDYNLETRRFEKCADIDIEFAD